MIVELCFAGPGADIDAWREALAASDGRRRTVLCTTLVDASPDAPHPAIAISWFHDEADRDRDRDRIDLPDATTVVARPEVRRGADWLETRWRDGGTRYKHVAVARRAEGLAPAEFADRWRAHAGAVGATPIPDEARGLAYVQHHPVPWPPPHGISRSFPGGVRTTNEISRGGWVYDAVNEVWFDDLDGLRRRIEWMNEALAGGPDLDLFGEHHLFAVREDVVRDDLATRA